MYRKKEAKFVLYVAPCKYSLTPLNYIDVFTKSRKSFKYRSTQCLNCKAPLELTDKFCSQCSQRNSTKPISFSDFFAEILSNFINYDSRLRYTVKDLLFKPGTITKNYCEGQRLKYSNPFRFFLSVSLIYFLLYTVIGFFNPNQNTPVFNFSEDITPKYNEPYSILLKNSSDEDVSEAIKILSKNPTTQVLAARIAKEDSLQKLLTKSNKKTLIIDTGDTISSDNYKQRIKLLKSKGTIVGFFKKFEIMQDFYKDTAISNEQQALDSLNLEASKTNLWLYGKNKTIEKVEKDPMGLVQFLLRKTPLFLFFFAPFFALFFWIFYARQPYTYMEHLIFIFHIFSFVFLVLLLTAIPEIISGKRIFSGLLFGLIGPFYFYKALRNFYKQSRLKTGLKFIILNIVFIISASAMALVFFTATAATY